MTNSVAVAIKKANAITKGYGGYCLKFVQDCYGATARDASALIAWNRSKYQHKINNIGELLAIPVGAPLFMNRTGSEYGHVAIYLGNGLMRTTNSVTNKISTVSVDSWIKSGYYLLGWTSDIEGQLIPDFADKQTFAFPRGKYECVVGLLNVRESPSTVAKIVAQYKRGQTVNLLDFIEKNGYCWGVYKSWTRKIRYVAVRKISTGEIYLKKK